MQYELVGFGRRVRVALLLLPLNEVNIGWCQPHTLFFSPCQSYFMKVPKFYLPFHNFSEMMMK
jgi:hypothetical protein